MPRYWTNHWQNRNWTTEDPSTAPEPLEYSGSNLHLKRGVAAGDIVYIVSLQNGQLLLGGRLTVGEIVSRDEAVARVGHNRLWDASDWIVAERDSGTPFDTRRRLAPGIARELHFVSQKAGTRRLCFNADDYLNNQATRGIRELTRESARLLDDIIALTDSRPWDERAQDLDLTVTMGMIRSGTVGEDEASLTEEVSRTGTHVEGSVRQVLVNRYERSRRAREQCVERHGAACVICGFDFEQHYGQLAAGFIHVHHTRPLAEIAEAYEVDPVADLIPICPNCHAVIHLGGENRSPNEVRALLAIRRARNEGSATGG